MIKSLPYIASKTAKRKAFYSLSYIAQLHPKKVQFLRVKLLPIALISLQNETAFSLARKPETRQNSKWCWIQIPFPLHCYSYSQQILLFLKLLTNLQHSKNIPTDSAIEQGSDTILERFAAKSIPQQETYSNWNYAC